MTFNEWWLEHSKHLQQVNMLSDAALSMYERVARAAWERARECGYSDGYHDAQVMYSEF